MNSTWERREGVAWVNASFMPVAPEVQRAHPARGPRAVLEAGVLQVLRPVGNEPVDFPHLEISKSMVDDSVEGSILNLKI